MKPIPGWRYLVLLAGLALLALLVIEFNSRMTELNRLTEDRQEIQTRFNEVAGTKAALETQVAYAASNQAVEDWAYEQGRMIRPGDVPVIPLESTVTAAVPTPRPTVVATELSNWESWVALFTGPKSP
jgi:cell division protein FtsB